MIIIQLIAVQTLRNIHGHVILRCGLLLSSPAHLKVVNAIVDMKSFGQLLAETSEVQA